MRFEKAVFRQPLKAGNRLDPGGVRVATIVRVKFRWILPIGHLAIDCILLGALIVYSNSHAYRGDSGWKAISKSSLIFVQESGTVEWDPRTTGPPGSFSVIMSGNLPAGLVSVFLRPEAGIVGGRRRWDPSWFLLHQAVSLPFWYSLGIWADAGNVRLGKVLLVYLVVRFLVAVSGSYNVGWRVQILFWWSLILWAAGLGLHRLSRVCLRAAKRAF
jgi:hypothetical protein